MRIHLPNDPYSAVIQNFIVRDFANNVRLDKEDTLDLVTDAIIASGQIRYGPAPAPESLVAIREVIRFWIANSRPIPFILPWGSEKPDGSGVDVAELCALKTISCLQKRVQSVYPPGAQFNIRLEDASAPYLFYERMEQARAEARLYTTGFVNLVKVLDLDLFISAIPESSLVAEDKFNEQADTFYPYILKELQTGESDTFLKAYGWIPATHDTVKFYLDRNAAIYPDSTEQERIIRVARYFASSLTRRVMGINVANQAWQGKYLDLSFVAMPKATMGQFPRRIYYRTVPENMSSNHRPPWRSKGFLRISGNDVSAALTDFRTPCIYHPFSFQFEKDDLNVEVRADYVIKG